MREDRSVPTVRALPAFILRFCASSKKQLPPNPTQHTPTLLKPTFGYDHFLTRLLSRIFLRATKTSHEDANMATALLRLPEVKRRVGLSRSEIYRRITQGQFPKQVQLGARAVGWAEDDVERWIANRIGRVHQQSTSNENVSDQATEVNPWFAPKKN